MGRPTLEEGRPTSSPYEDRNRQRELHGPTIQTELNLTFKKSLPGCDRAIALHGHKCLNEAYLIHGQKKNFTLILGDYSTFKKSLPWCDRSKNLVDTSYNPKKYD